MGDHGLKRPLENISKKPRIRRLHWNYAVFHPILWHTYGIWSGFLLPSILGRETELITNFSRSPFPAWAPPPEVYTHPLFFPGGREKYGRGSFSSYMLYLFFKKNSVFFAGLQQGMVKDSWSFESMWARATRTTNNFPIPPDAPRENRGGGEGGRRRNNSLLLLLLLFSFPFFFADLPPIYRHAGRKERNE